MACASASERNRRAATPFANASLLLELQTRQMSKSPFALDAEDWIREVRAKSVVGENHAAEAPCLVRLALPRNARRRGFAPTLQMRFVFLSKREWPDRPHASILADAANHVLTLASCLANRDHEFCLRLYPQ